METIIVSIIFGIIFVVAFIKMRKNMKHGGCPGCSGHCDAKEKISCQQLQDHQ